MTGKPTALFWLIVGSFSLLAGMQMTPALDSPTLRHRTPRADARGALSGTSPAQ